MLERNLDAIVTWTPGTNLGQLRRGTNWAGLLLLGLLASPLAWPQAAELPVREVILYKHGVGYFQRSGELAAGGIAQLDFKASEMDDVLKSLTIVDATGAPVAGVRYDASEPVERRLQDFPFEVGDQVSLAAFLDQMKGARLELRLGPNTIQGSIVSARVVRAGDGPNAVERQTIVLLTDSGEIQSFDLDAASSVRLVDPRQQELLRDYLAVLSGARSRDRRSVYIDSTSADARQISAAYMTPAAVWKSSYRLLFRDNSEPTLEGWAIVDNTSGDDWENVQLSVVSGRPISFITQLYEPRYVDRPRAELAENQAVAPQVFEGAIEDQIRINGSPANTQAFRRDSERPQAPGAVGGFVGSAAESVPVQARLLKTEESSLNVATQGRDLGELFEYSFSGPVTVKQGESAMLPFLQEDVEARKLLIYSESFGTQNPYNAAEITNVTGKTLDGGPITVYDAGGYAGEALVETLKDGDKRLISYGLDLGTRITTQFDSSSANVREIHVRRGLLTTRNAMQETKTYTIRNVDAERKTVIIQHPKRQGYELMGNLTPETTEDSYRFEIAVGGDNTETFAVQEERVYDQTLQISSLNPGLLATYIRNGAISANGRRQLEEIAAKQEELATADAQINNAQMAINDLNEDQSRIRQNIESLRAVAGQQDQVQEYARQLSEAETRLVALRDEQSQLRRTRATLQAELNTLIENAEF